MWDYWKTDFSEYWMNPYGTRYLILGTNCVAIPETLAVCWPIIWCCLTLHPLHLNQPWFVAAGDAVAGIILNLCLLFYLFTFILLSIFPLLIFLLLSFTFISIFTFNTVNSLQYLWPLEEAWISFQRQKFLPLPSPFL